jgi:anti-sigma factor RsiW
MSHASDETLGRYVSGLLEGAEADALEAHVAACAACAQRLQREAKVELALGQALTAAPSPVRQRPWVRVAVVPLLAAAAAVVLLLGPGGGASLGPDAGIEQVPTPSLSATAAPLLEVTRYEGDTPHAVLATPAPL